MVSGEGVKGFFGLQAHTASRQLREECFLCLRFQFLPAGVCSRLRYGLGHLSVAGRIP